MSIVMLIIALIMDNYGYLDKIAIGIYELFGVDLSSSGLIVLAFLIGLMLDTLDRIKKR